MLGSNSNIVENAKSTGSRLSSVMAWWTDDGDRRTALSLHDRVDSLDEDNFGS